MKKFINIFHKKFGGLLGVKDLQLSSNQSE